MEIEQQTNCQEERKQKCSNVLNLASTHFFNLVRAPLIAKMAKLAINKRRMKKRQKKVYGSLSQLVLFNSTKTSFGSRNDKREKKPKKFKFCDSLCPLRSHNLFHNRTSTLAMTPFE
jgi:hypothetical protein